jgi:hypothetical protein
MLIQDHLVKNDQSSRYILKPRSPSSYIFLSREVLTDSDKLILPRGYAFVWSPFSFIDLGKGYLKRSLSNIPEFVYKLIEVFGRVSRSLASPFDSKDGTHV